jgi:Uma2 family endonuclease
MNKREVYQSIESVSDYLLVEPDSVYVTHYRRNAAGWKKRIYDNAEDVIDLGSLGVQLTLSEIYLDVAIR